MPVLIFMDLEWNTAFYRDRDGQRVPFHELIEVAAMKVEPSTGVMLDSFHSYVHPKVSRKIDNRTIRLLPYSREELQGLLADAPTFLDLGPAFLRWCGPDPCFVEWGNNDVEVLLKNFAYHKLSFDEGWKCEYYDLQYIYQKLYGGDMGCQPSLEKAVTELQMDRSLDFHSAWNDTYYTVMVYQTMLDQFEDLKLFHKPPKQKGLPPLWELELGTYATRWAGKNRPEVAEPKCPLCGEPLARARWLRTGPTEQVLRCRCPEHGRLYMAVTAEKQDKEWVGKAAIYKDAGPIAERYRKVSRKLREKERREKERREGGQSAQTKRTKTSA